MRVLFDECLPTRKLRPAFRGHDVASVRETRWSGITNGNLPALSELELGAFLAADSNLRYQPHTPNADLLIVMLRASGNRLEDLLPLVADANEALHAGRSRKVIEVFFS